MSRIVWGIVLVSFSSFVGLGLSAYLTWHRWALESGALGQSFCSISPYIDCDKVSTSKYGVMLGVPTGVWNGILFFTILLGLLAIAWSHGRVRSLLTTIVLGLSAAAIGICAVLAGISVSIVQSFCILCGALYLLNALNGVGLFLLRPWMRRSSPPRPVFAVGIVLVTAFAGALTTWALARSVQRDIEAGSAEAREKVIELLNSSPRVPVNLELGISYGAVNPRLTIAIFSDFRCPACKGFDAAVRQVIESYRDRVQIRFFNFPLDSACNPSVDRAVHPGACELARAQICGAPLGDALTVTHALYEFEGARTPSALAALMTTMGIDVKPFEACMAGGEAERALSAQVGEGNRLAINATPTVYMNGRPVPGVHSPVLLRMMIDHELNR